MTPTGSKPPKAPARLVARSELHALVERICSRHGWGAKDAKDIADVLVWANLTGRDGHGVTRLPRYIEMIRTGELDPRGAVQIERQLPATLLMDANRAAGPVAMIAAMDIAIERAKVQGGCFALVRRTTHAGALGFYALKAASQDMIAIVFSSGKPLMAYHGASVPSLSTSPVAFAVPGIGGPILLDMATSMASLGKLRQMAAADLDLPEGWALTADGKPARRAADAEIPLPLGGAKGSGLALMFEMLTGVLAGAPVIAPALLRGRSGLGANAMVIVLDVAAFGTRETFLAEVQELRSAIKALPRQDGFDDIYFPGERSQKVADARASGGIPVPAVLFEKLETLAAGPDA